MFLATSHLCQDLSLFQMTFIYVFVVKALQIFIAIGMLREWTEEYNNKCISSRFLKRTYPTFKYISKPSLLLLE